MYLVFRNQQAAFQEQCRLDGVPPEQCSMTDKLLHDFSTVHLGWIVAVVLAFTLSNLFRALRWQMLLEPMGYRVKLSNSLLTILLGYFANLGFPRMGEVVRAGSLARYERLPPEKVMGTLVIDRLMDVVCLGIVVGLAFLMEGDTLLHFLRQPKPGATTPDTPLWQSPIAWVLLLLFALAVMAFFFFREKLTQVALVKKMLGMLQGFWDGLRSILKLKQPGMFLLYSAGIWLMFYLQCYFNLKAFPPTAHLGAGAALMIFVFGTLGFLIPSPGGMGTYHALCIVALALYGISGSDAFSYANIAFFTIQIIYNLVAGTLALQLLPIINKKKNDPLRAD
ncbi:MAG: flippase-like domain-containing protein [Saprospiraceae bacterium]|nr:flippase-like domain-containing protein [Saprospiraceae bacterium]